MDITLTRTAPMKMKVDAGDMPEVTALMAPQCKAHHFLNLMKTTRLLRTKLMKIRMEESSFCRK